MRAPLGHSDENPSFKSQYSGSHKIDHQLHNNSLQLSKNQWDYFQVLQLALNVHHLLLI